MQAVLFDVDGTLYDQRSLRAWMLRRLLTHAAAHPREGWTILRILRAYRRAQEQLRTDGREDAASAQLPIAARTVGIPTSVAAGYVERWMEQVPLVRLPGMAAPGLDAFLTTARSRGLRLGVVSDYPAVRKLEVLGISSYFEVVVCAQDPEVQRFKPDPSSLRVAMRRLGLPPEEVLFVGDRLDVDGEAARRAGVRFVWMGRGHRWRGRKPVASCVETVPGYERLGELIFSPPA